MNDTLTRDANGRGFDSRQVHHFINTYMKTLNIIILLLLISCNDQHVLVDYSMHDEIVQQDLHNKQKELMILRELHIAQTNQDDEARMFFMQEYMRVPRLKMSAEQKQHPDYKQWLSEDVIKSGEFMHVKYDFVSNTTE